MIGAGATLDEYLRGLVRDAVRDALGAAAPAASTERLLTTRAFAKREGVAPSTVRAYVKAGKLPAVMVGNTFRIPADAQIGAPKTLPRKLSSDERVAQITRRGAR